MKRRILMLGLLLSCTFAHAEWAMVGRNEDLRLFVDRDALQRDGDVATISQLVDYTHAQWAGSMVVMSVRQLVEYDCQNRRTRTVAGAAYSEQMGNGRQVTAQRMPDAEWVPVPAEGTPNQLWRIACGRE